MHTKMLTIRLTISFALALLFVPGGLSSVARAADGLHESLLLVGKGISHAPIVVFHDAPPRTREAADQLAEYMEKISGVRPMVIEGEPDPIPERGIWIGYQPLLKKLFPDTDFDFKRPEEILIKANGQHLVIAGRDRWDPEHMEGWGRLAPITGRQLEYGTINAVYTFLQDYLHVRWLWPGESGEDILPRETIAFAPFEYRYAPQIRSRNSLFVGLAPGYSKDGPEQLWARFQRLQLDALKIAGNHGFGDWWEKYREQHPDFFALQPDGTRSGWPGDRYAKLCDSSPAVWEQWLQEVEETLREDPTRTVFNASPNDGWPSGHCVCENCRAWDHPGGAIVTYRWQGITEDRPAITDRHVTFANTLARLLKKRFPDRALFVQMHAYGLSRPAPVGVAPDDNVIISSVANFHMRGEGVSDERTKHMQQFKDWAAVAPNLAWRPNLGNAVGLQWGMPDVAMTQAAEDFRFVADHGCIGLLFDRLWGHWSTQGPHYYLVARLAWDPHIDADAVMEDYYERGFGPAARQVKAYWTLMEQTRNEMVAKEKNRLRAYELPRYYTAELLDRAEGLLKEAARQAVNGPAVCGKRVAFVQGGLDYTRLVVDTRRWMQKVEESKAQDLEAVEKVHACWASALDMKKRLTPFSINWWMVYNQPANKRMMGLHPENPLSGRTLREARTPVLE